MLIIRAITRVFNFWIDLYYARLRRIDREILWEAMKELTDGDVEIARRGFMLHAMDDPAWTRGGTDLCINRLALAMKQRV